MTAGMQESLLPKRFGGRDFVFEEKESFAAARSRHIARGQARGRIGVVAKVGPQARSKEAREQAKEAAGEEGDDEAELIHVKMDASG